MMKTLDPLSDEALGLEKWHQRGLKIRSIFDRLVSIFKVVTIVSVGALMVLYTFPNWNIIFSRLNGHTDDILPSVKQFQWSSITAKKHLEFTPCFDGFECAKLQVPLDYFNGTYPDEYVSIALTKLPAKVPVDDPRYGGPVLINPGGPGGSGVALALFEGQHIQTIVDPAKPPYSTSLNSSAKYYDVIGFDPRGIGNTEPAAKCMPDGASGWSWNLRTSSEGNLDSSDAALGRLWSMEKAYGSSCLKALEASGRPDIKQYINTASVATDMITIIERHAEYVASKTKRKSGCGSKAKSEPNVDKPKLHYWGFSYGTYLGATFASMYPDRVGRLILDGVVNSDDYNKSLGGNELHDTEKAMNLFYTFCVAAGPEKCLLATPNSAPEDIKERLNRIVRSLYHNPIPVDTEDGPEVLTFSLARAMIFSSLYAPALVFPSIAYIFKKIEENDRDFIDALAIALRPQHIYTCSLNNTAPWVPPLGDATYAVLCSDGDSKGNETIDQFEKRWKKLAAISPTGGSLWSMHLMKCASWKIRALHRFRGPFGGNTSHPILFISTTADPVTPLRSARIMSARFPGSSLIIQDSAGHCSGSMPTPCTLKHAREYFQTGALPTKNTLCIPPHSDFSLNSTHPASPFFDAELAQWALKLDCKTRKELKQSSDLSPLMKSTLANAHDLLNIEQDPLTYGVDHRTMCAAHAMQNSLARRGEHFGLIGEGKKALKAVMHIKEKNLRFFQGRPLN